MNDIRTAALKPQLRLPGMRDITPSIMLLLAARASAIGIFPFGIAFFAAAFDKSAAYIGLVSVCIGIVSSAGIEAVPKYLIALILYWLFDKLYRHEDDVICSIACGIAVLTGGAAMMFTKFNGLYDVFLLFTESIISALMYIVFRKSRIIAVDFTSRGRLSSDEYICAAITVGVIIAGFSGISLWRLSPVNILAVYAVLIAALNSPIAVSGCTGLCIGFLASMSGSYAIIIMGVYAMGALFASFMNNCRRIGCAIGYISASAVSLIYLKNIYDIPLSMLDTTAGTLLFLVTPNVVHEYLRSFFTKSSQVEAVSPDNRMREYLSMRLSKTSEAFASLHECFVSVSEGRLKKYSDDVGIILDETADRVCADCRMCGRCWQSDFRKTYKKVLELIGIIEKEGILTRENIPKQFCDKCVRTEWFIYEINHVYELYKRDVLRRSDAIVTRNLISTQYSELDRLFSGMAGDIEQGFHFLEAEEERLVDELDKAGITPYEVSAIESMSGSSEVYLRLPPAANKSTVEGIVSKVLRQPVAFEKTDGGLSLYSSKPCYSIESASLQLPQDGSTVNGDSVTVFTADGGYFYAIAADGMGSGNEAQYESAATLRLLTSFLKSGFSVKTALGILNSALCINMNNEIFSTVDLLSVNLYTGKAELYKIGSADTIIVSGDSVKSISSSSVPVGILSDIRLDNKGMQLKEGDVIIMMTDGVTEAGCSVSGADWIKKLAVMPHDSMEQLAKEIMDTALSKNKNIARDDMSIIALRFMGA